MSITVSNNKSGCGCASSSPVAPSNLMAVPPGTMIVQSPAAQGCAPQSSAQISASQAGASTASCDQYRNPCVTAGFTTPAISKSGSFFAACASSWGMPGLRLFFPGLGYLEVLGVNGNVVTYSNLTIEPGTQILEGTCFHHDAPQITTTSEDEGEGSYESSSTMDALYGEEGNQLKKILPADGMMLFACGGKWKRRQAGLMFYPITPANLLSTSSASSQSVAATLPNKPSSSELECSLGLQLAVQLQLAVASTVSGQYPVINLSVGGRHVLDNYAHPGQQHNNSFSMIPVGKTDTTVPILVTNVNGHVGAATITVQLLGYYY